MHLGRLGLMLADHHYSGLTDPSARSDLNPAYPLFANTNRKTGTFNQTLDEHLLGVARHAGMVAHALPGFEHHLLRLVRHKGLRKRSADARFRWQDRAADLAGAMREAAARHGAFIVNMASTQFLLAEERDMTLEACAERYGTVTLPENPQGWRFHPALGFTRQR